MPHTTSHPFKLALFASLSLADLGLTWLLIRHSDGQVYEGNPIANWWLSTFGWSGLALFKFLAVLLVGGLCLVIARHSPRAGGRLLALGCATLAGVLLYSCSLAGYVSAEGFGDHEARLHRLRDQTTLLDDKIETGTAYREEVVRLNRELIGGRLTLPEAVEQLADTERGRDPEWLESLRDNHPGCSDQQLLAINLIRHTAVALRSCPSQAHEVVERLDAELAAAYGRSLDDLGVYLPLGGGLIHPKPRTGPRSVPLS